jgi:hypothetical protein
VARPPELQPPAAPARWRLAATAGEVEWGTGVSPRGSPELERRCNSGEGGSGGALNTSSLGAWREGKEVQGRSGESRGCRFTLL